MSIIKLPADKLTNCKPLELKENINWPNQLKLPWIQAFNKQNIVIYNHLQLEISKKEKTK